MKTVPTTPQDMAAQMLDAYPYFSEYAMPEDEAIRLGEQAKILRAEVASIKPYMLSDDELALRLADIKRRALEGGMWRADKGKGAEGRLAYAIEREKGRGYTDEEAATQASRELKRCGYLEAMADARKERERLFRDPIKEYTDSHAVSAEAERAKVTKRLEHAITIATLTESELATLSRSFPSGNFLYHGTGTEQLIKILDSGVLANAMALDERETAAAKAEGREADSIRHNSGFEGISWSMNRIDALPGDRYHLAGFVAAPEAVLGSGQQLAVPSRPAPYEVLQISLKIDARTFYDAKTQFELYRSQAMLGETNSVFNNLLSAALWKKKERSLSANEPMLYRAKHGLLAQPAYQAQLRELYSVSKDGRIRLDPNLLQQTDSEIPVAAVWLQAAIDEGRFAGTHFADKELSAIIDALDSATVKELINTSRQDWQQYESMLDKAEKAAGAIEVAVEDMYFVAPHKDAETWLSVIACSPHKPAGILLYDDQKVRLENFASLHRGDHRELTAELQAAISPKNEGYIDYSRVLGREFSDDMRTGHKGQVIAERYLSNRSIITLLDGKLSIER